MRPPRWRGSFWSCAAEARGSRRMVRPWLHAAWYEQPFLPFFVDSQSAPVRVFSAQVSDHRCQVSVGINMWSFFCFFFVFFARRVYLFFVGCAVRRRRLESRPRANPLARGCRGGVKAAKKRKTCALTGDRCVQRAGAHRTWVGTHALTQPTLYSNTYKW